MLFMRILGQGRISEILDSSDESLQIDTFFSKMSWHRSQPSETGLSLRAQTACEAYINGINAAFKQSTPWELKILGYQPEPWSMADIYLLARMGSYLTLAQSQGEIEQLIIQMVKKGVSRAKLDALFGDALQGMDEELIQKVKTSIPFVPNSVKWNAGSTRFMASNNWVISGRKAASGKPILASDPHLEINRLPSVWYEVVLTKADRYAIAATMPGIPGMIIARTPHLSWGPTYTFMDTIDSWVEQCKDGCYRKGEQWLPFRERNETILRKKKKPVNIKFFENEHGVLDGDPSVDEYALATRWTTTHAGPRSINKMIELWDADTVDVGMNTIGALEPAFNWVLADQEGNIGYQMSGLMPKRREGWSGLYPVKGWDPENDWQGFIDHVDLPRCINPDEGFFVTANQNLNTYGNAKAINVCQGPYRSDRLSDLLAQRDDWTAEANIALQLDTYSVQADPFLELLQGKLEGGGNAKILKDWNRHYELDSQGAFLFEDFYRRLRKKVFGSLGLGEEVIDFLSDQTGIFADFFIGFDEVILRKDPAWFDTNTREECIAEALNETLSITPEAWGKNRNLVLSHILFGGKLPLCLGFDRGPVPLKGGRATPHQGQIYQADGRATSFAPSIRFITDMAQDNAQTCLVGGPSDRRFSKWYASEIKDWEAGRLKLLRP